MRIYEELFIVKPDAPEEEVDGFVEQLRGQLTTGGATVDKVEKWGKRRLAYKVDKYREGSYVLFQFTAGADTVKELERRLRSRGQDSDEEIARRLARARSEIEAFGQYYDFCVMNRDVKQAGSEVESILTAVRCSRVRQRGRVVELLASFGGKD